jgi:hypothetical protein
MRNKEDDGEGNPGRKRKHAETSTESREADHAPTGRNDGRGKSRFQDTNYGEDEMDQDDDSVQVQVLQGALRPPAGGYRFAYSERRSREMSAKRGQRDEFACREGGESSRGRYHPCRSPEQYRRPRDRRHDYSEDKEDCTYRSRKRLNLQRRHFGLDDEDNGHDINHRFRRKSSWTSPPTNSKSRKPPPVKKQFYELDRKGEPCGKMADPFRKDLCAFARLLDPSKRWEKQTQEDKLKLENRVYKEWQFFGDSSRVSL